MSGSWTAVDLITVLVAVTVFSLGLLVVELLIQRSSLLSRISAVAAPRRRPTSSEPGRAVATRVDSQRNDLGLLRAIVHRLRLIRSRQAASVRLRLSHAGWRSNDALTLYLFGKLALPFALGGLATLLLYGLQAWDLGGLQRAMLVVLAALVGSYFPDLLLKNAKQRRQEALRMAVPDALDLMVICAEAGLGLDPAITRIARELRSSCPEMADELDLTASELRFLPDRRQAWDNLALRTDLAAVRSLVNALVQTERYGTSLTQSVRVLAQEQRAERMLRAEEKAARLPAVMTVPLILFILPALFVILMGPAVIDIMEVLANL